MPRKKQPETQAEKQAEESRMDERTAIPLDPETALRALLQVDPEDEPAKRDSGAARPE